MARYEKGYSGLDILNYIKIYSPNEEDKFKKLICFDKVRREFRNEKIFIFFLLNFIFLRFNYDLENISFM